MGETTNILHFEKISTKCSLESFSTDKNSDCWISILRLKSGLVRMDSLFIDNAYSSLIWCKKILHYTIRFWLFWAKSQQSVLNWLSEHEYQFESVGHTNTVCSAVMRIESQTLAKPNSPKYRRVLLKVQRQVQIQTCLQTMLNLWWIVKQSIPQIVAVVLLKQNSGFEAVRQEVWSIWWAEAHKQLWSLLWRVMWMTSTFYASSYIERCDVEQFAALICKTF